MKETKRNILVGITVIVALLMLAGLIVIFAGLPQMFQSGYVIRMRADSTHEVYEGDSVYLAGMRVGRVIDVRFTDPDRPAKGVTLVTRIDEGIRVPARAKAVIFTRGFVGGAYLTLSVSDVPETGADEFLPTDGSAVMEIEHRGSGLIPKELREGMDSVAELAENINSLIGPPRAPAAAATSPTDEPIPEDLRGAVVRLNRTLDAVRQVVGDAENRRNLKDALANVNRATEEATEAMAALTEFAEAARKTAADAGETVAKFSETAEEANRTAAAARERIDDVAVRLIDSAEKVSQLMATLNAAATKIEKGDGTAGRLINDPKLYNNLVDATQQMAAMMKDLRALLETWKESGVPLKIK